MRGEILIGEFSARLVQHAFAIPQVRGGGFYPSALKKGSRTDQAVNLMMAEMYVQGVSTRKGIEVLQRLLGPDHFKSSSHSGAGVFA